MLFTSNNYIDFVKFTLDVHILLLIETLREHSHRASRDEDMAGGANPKRLTTPRRKKPAAAHQRDPQPRGGQPAAARERSRSRDLPEGNRRAPPTTPVPVIPDSELEDDRNWAPRLDEFDDIDDMHRAKRDWERYLVQKARTISAGASRADLKKLLREYVDRDLDASSKSDSEERERLEAARAILEVEEFEKADEERRRLALDAAFQEGARAREHVDRERAAKEARHRERRDHVRKETLESARELEAIVERDAVAAAVAEAVGAVAIAVEEEASAATTAEMDTPPPAQRDPRDSPRGPRVLESPPKRTRFIGADDDEIEMASEEDNIGHLAT